VRSRVLLTLWRAMRGQRRRGAPSPTTALRTLPRLVAATASGRYRGTSPRQLAMMAGAMAYIAMPVDLVPELAFLGAGLLDDAVVLAWLAGAVLTETEAFLAWEREEQAGPHGTQRPAPGWPGARQPHATHTDHGDGPDVVVGEVIR